MRLMPVESMSQAKGFSGFFGLDRRGRAGRVFGDSSSSSSSEPRASSVSMASETAILTVRGDDAVSEASCAASEFEAASDGLRFFLIGRDGGCSSSLEAFRFLRERDPSIGSSGRMRSLNIECPPGLSTPRCEGRRSLATSLGTGECLRRVADSAVCFVSSSSPCSTQVEHRQCFASSSGLRELAVRAHCRCAWSPHTAQSRYSSNSSLGSCSSSSPQYMHLLGSTSSVSTSSAASLSASHPCSASDSELPESDSELSLGLASDEESIIASSTSSSSSSEASSCADILTAPTGSPASSSSISSPSASTSDPSASVVFPS